MLQSLIQLKPRDVPLRVALRNAAAVVMPLGIGIATGHVGIGLGISAGALNTMFLDQPGPYRLRMQHAPAQIPVELDRLWCARSFERIGDRCKNLCEYVLYLVRGKDVRHSGLAKSGSD